MTGCPKFSNQRNVRFQNQSLNRSAFGFPLDSAWSNSIDYNRPPSWPLVGPWWSWPYRRLRFKAVAWTRNQFSNWPGHFLAGYLVDFGLSPMNRVESANNTARMSAPHRRILARVSHQVMSRPIRPTAGIDALYSVPPLIRSLSVESFRRSILAGKAAPVRPDTARSRSGTSQVSVY